MSEVIEPKDVRIAVPSIASGMLIDGSIVGGEAFLEVINPATGLPFALAPDATRAQLENAVAAAGRAFPAWSATSFEERRAAIDRIAAKLRERVDEIGAILTAEQGKPLRDAVGEILRAADNMEALAALDISDQLLRDDGRERVWMRHRPLGVVGGITPWNVPIGLAMVKVAQGLYTGNTLVLKPSPFTPLSTLAVGQAIADLVPAGVINIVSGGNALGAWITGHPDIAKISFTGSVATGRLVLQSAAATFKRVTLELGGNDPAIVLPDVDIATAAAGIVRSTFANCGQVCMAIKRVYVHNSIRDEMIAAMVEQVRAIRIGPGDDPASTMGPIQNRMQFEKVAALIEDVRKSEGAQIVTGGTVHRGGGYFIEPTIVTGLSDDSPLVREEQFGPLMPVLVFDDIDDAVARANGTEFGLGGSVWTRDLAAGRAVAERIEAGSVWVNRHLGNAKDVPFGGAKHSGYGREQGVAGMLSYTEMQAVAVPIG